MESRAPRVFANEIGELRRMSEWLQRVAADEGLDADAAWQAELCLNEAASNIMLYGHHDGEPHPITVRIEPIGRFVRLTISDDGEPFNPLEADPPRAARTLQDAPVGGLGIHLIKSFASDVRYRREQHKNVLILTFKPNGDDAP